MARVKGGLGRGLEALFGDSLPELEPVSIINPEAVSEKAAKARPAEGGGAAAKKSAAKGARTGAKGTAKATGDAIEYIALSDIKPNARQPRKNFDENALAELADSIKQHGVIQPVVLRPSGKVYELVAGERRWRAAKKAGLKTIPAIVRELGERQSMFFALIENMQREDLNAIEEAHGIFEIMESFGLNQEEAAKVIGRSRPYVANSLRLLKLPEKVKRLLEEELLSAGHVRAIAGLTGEALQIEAAEKAVKEGWSVRKIESYTGAVRKRKPAGSRARKDRELAAIEEKLSTQLGTKVKISGTENRGRLELEYYSRGELERLLEVLL